MGYAVEQKQVEDPFHDAVHHAGNFFGYDWVFGALLIGAIVLGMVVFKKNLFGIASVLKGLWKGIK